MEAITSPNRSKITVRVWAPILDALIARTDAACLRRDLLISRTLQLELPRISEEIPHRNSAMARRYLEAQLRSLFARPPGARQISLALEPQVAVQLESVCDAMNVPREILLNRLFMLLGAPGEFMAANFTQFTPAPLSKSDFEPSWDPTDVVPRSGGPADLYAEAASGRLHDVQTIALDMTRLDEASADYDHALSPLGRINSVVSDPLRWYRRMLQISFEQINGPLIASGSADDVAAMKRESFIFTPFGMNFEDQELLGLNCYCPDHWIPGSPAARLIHPPTAVDPSPAVVPSPAAKRTRRTK